MNRRIDREIHSRKREKQNIKESIGCINYSVSLVLLLLVISRNCTECLITETRERAIGRKSGGHDGILRRRHSRENIFGASIRAPLIYLVPLERGKRKIVAAAITRFRSCLRVFVISEGSRER